MNRTDKLSRLGMGIFLTILVYGVSVFVGHRWQLSSDFFPVSFLTHATMLLLSVGLILLLASQVKYRFALPKPKQMIKPVCVALLTTLVINITLAILSFAIFGSAESHPLMEGLTPLQYVLFILILAPIAEEHLFRGLLQNYLKPMSDKGFSLRSCRISFPVLTSAVAFSMAHLILLTAGVSPMFVIRVLVFTFFLGLIAGYYQEKYDNIAFAILVHMTGNLMGLFSIINSGVSGV